MEKGEDGRRRGEEKNLRLAYILTSLVYTTNRLLHTSPYYPYISLYIPYIPYRGSKMANKINRLGHSLFLSTSIILPFNIYNSSFEHL